MVLLLVPNLLHDLPVLRNADDMVVGSDRAVRCMFRYVSLVSSTLYDGYWWLPRFPRQCAGILWTINQSYVCLLLSSLPMTIST